jgi:hypothetical protein
MLGGLTAIAVSASDANARYYQTGVNVYPEVATPMSPMAATPMPMRTPAFAMANSERPHVGVNVYPGVYAPMPPVMAMPIPGTIPTEIRNNFERPHVGVNVYPGVPTPMSPNPMAQFADGPNLYQYVRSNPIGNLDPTGLSTKCGTAYLSCKTGVKPWDVYGCSNRAKLILGGERGCVTLLLPKAIFCTGSCEDIKGWRSAGNPSIKLLDHEACHACAFEDKGLLEYLRTWIPGDIESPKYCDRHPITSTCNW